MESIFFEDQEMYDYQRQTTGMGQDIYNTLDTVTNAMAKTNPPTTDMGNKPYPLGTVDKIMADAFINLMNVSKLLDEAKANPVLKKKKKSIEDVKKKINKINKELVVISELVDKI